MGLQPLAQGPADGLGALAQRFGEREGDEGEAAGKLLARGLEGEAGERDFDAENGLGGGLQRGFEGLF